MSRSKVHELAGIEVESSVSATDGEPFVIIRCSTTDGDVVVGQADKATALTIALDLIEAAAAAEQDAIVFAVLSKALGAETAAGFIVGPIREERARRDADHVDNDNAPPPS